MSQQPPLFPLDVYHLAFQAPVALDPHLPTIPSDALFASLAAAWGRAQGSAQAEALWWEPFRAGRPPFLLTSAFPYAGWVRFYPWPPASRWLWPPQQRDAVGSHPELAPARFFSAGILAQALQGKDPTPLLVGPEARALQGGLLRLSAQELAEKSRLPGEQTELWRPTADGQVRFGPVAGLWLGVWWLQGGPKTLADGTPWRTAWKQALAAWLRDNPWGPARCVRTGDTGEPCPVLIQPILPKPGPGLVYLLSRAAPEPGSPVEPVAGHPVLGGIVPRWDAGSLLRVRQLPLGRVVETDAGPVYGYGLPLPWPE